VHAGRCIITGCSSSEGGLTCTGVQTDLSCSPFWSHRTCFFYHRPCDALWLQQEAKRRCREEEEGMKRRRRRKERGCKENRDPEDLHRTRGTLKLNRRR